MIALRLRSGSIFNEVLLKKSFLDSVSVIGAVFPSNHTSAPGDPLKSENPPRALSGRDCCMALSTSFYSCLDFLARSVLLGLR